MVKISSARTSKKPKGNRYAQLNTEVEVNTPPLLGRTSQRHEQSKSIFSIIYGTYVLFHRVSLTLSEHL